MTHAIDVIVVTWNLPEYLNPCMDSILTHYVTEDLFRVILVNNGHPESVSRWKDHPAVNIVQMKENAGWEGGLKAGLAVSKAPYVVFMNDDTHIPASSSLWLSQMVRHFGNPSCAAVGPSSNVVMGPQNAFINMRPTVLSVPFLIGFCLMIRRSDLDAAGGVDETLPGGDDFDLSIRLRKLGKNLICDRNVFVYHHGFKSGTRKHGDYWNSAEMAQKTSTALIQKHGLRAYWETITIQPRILPVVGYSNSDVEGDVVRAHILGDKILDLACGGRKTVPEAVGVDITPKGEMIPGLHGVVSVADVVADIQEPLPFEWESVDTIIARHCLEHCVDLSQTLRYWRRVLKPSGRLIIAVPDQALTNTIPMNFQHVHAFTKDSLRSLMLDMGWGWEATIDSGNGVSFVGIFTKISEGPVKEPCNSAEKKMAHV